MKKQLNLIIMTLLAVVTLASCSDSVTYADLKKKERNAINRYISNKRYKRYLRQNLKSRASPPTPRRTSTYSSKATAYICR